MKEGDEVFAAYAYEQSGYIYYFLLKVKLRNMTESGTITVASAEVLERYSTSYAGSSRWIGYHAMTDFHETAERAKKYLVDQIFAAVTIR